ncbi:hypothetical protein THAOC_05169 [Thalassiosira oceanica]|uniref:Uncharacterized protein n=1 Tax=Thalassiosira oceanica TaxID=159749 RepID=K0T815_THAOC|nr:hypothetical protein THAOC_05169 [Thalassiosira oceanica]|eukprot:EJK73219.1 hypothetical protein THAOC_05169 [Thalassiosira oceanica]
MHSNSNVDHGASMPRPDATAHPAIVAATSPCFSIHRYPAAATRASPKGRDDSPGGSRAPAVRRSMSGLRSSSEEMITGSYLSSDSDNRAEDARSRAGRPGKFSAAALEGQVLARVGVCRRRGPGTPLGLDCVRHGPRFRRLNEGRRTMQQSNRPEDHGIRHGGADKIEDDPSKYCAAPPSAPVA